MAKVDNDDKNYSVIISRVPSNRQALRLIKDLREIDSPKYKWELRTDAPPPVIIDRPGNENYAEVKNLRIDCPDATKYKGHPAFKGWYYDEIGSEPPVCASVDFRTMAAIMWNSTFAHQYNRTPDWEWFEAAQDGANKLFGHDWSIRYLLTPIMVHDDKWMDKIDPHLRCYVDVSVYDANSDTMYETHLGKRPGKRMTCLVDISYADYESACLLAMENWANGNQPIKRLKYPGYGKDIAHPSLWEHRDVA